MPALSHEEFEALKLDIRLRGVLVPLEFDNDGHLLDGHHRWRAIQELLAAGIKVDYTSIIRAGLSEDEKRAHVRSLNLNRRHLTQAQRREVMADQLRDTPQTSDRQIAHKLGVSDKSVAATRRRLESIAEIPRCSERQCADGRKYPSVIAKNQKETQRALTALNGLNANVLAGHPIDVRLLERTRRETDSAEKAKGVAHEPTLIGQAEIRCGDFRDVLHDIPEGSVDLVLTDPPYSGEHLALWDDLGTFASRVLRKGGVFAAYSGQSHLPYILATLSRHLDFVWMIAQLGHARKTHIYNRRAYSLWKPILVFARPPYQGKWFDDVLRGAGPEKNAHEWQQREDEAQRLVEMFSNPSDLVIDPMMGSGTIAAASVSLGRRFMGSDIDAAAVAASRERVRLLQRQE